MLYCATISNTLFHHTNRVVKPSEKNNGQLSSYCRMIPPEWQDDRREMRWQPPSPCFVMLAEQQESQGEMGWQLGARCVSDSLTLVNAMCQHGMRDAGEINRVQVSLLRICYGFETSISQYATKKCGHPRNNFKEIVTEWPHIAPLF